MLTVKIDDLTLPLILWFYKYVLFNDECLNAWKQNVSAGCMCLHARAHVFGGVGSVMVLKLRTMILKVFFLFWLFIWRKIIFRISPFCSGFIEIVIRYFTYCLYIHTFVFTCKYIMLRWFSDFLLKYYKKPGGMIEWPRWPDHELFQWPKYSDENNTFHFRNYARIDRDNVNLTVYSHGSSMLYLQSAWYL